MYKWYKRLVYTHPDLLARFCKVNLSNAKKIRPDFFSRPNQSYGDQEPLWLLNVIEDDCYLSLDSNVEAPGFMSEIQSSSVFAESASLVPHNPFVST